MSNNKARKDFFDYIHPFTSKYVKPVFDIFRNRPLSLFSIFLIFLGIIIFFSFILKVIVISFLILIGGLSKIYQRYTHLPLGFELVMFSTIVSGYLYGPVVGGIVGITSFGLATYFSVRYTAYIIPSFIIYFLAGVLTPLFSSVSLAGLVFSAVFVIVLSFISIVLTMSRPDRVFMFAVTNMSWNIWVFVFLAPRIINLLS